MIKYKDTILEDFFIDPVTAIITNSKGEVQETYIKKGRQCFKKHCIHEWQVHTHIGYKEGYDVHHLDENKMNNSLSNLVYLTRSEHIRLHKKGRILSEDTKRKMSESHKGKNTWSTNLIWINNGVISKMLKCDEEIPEGFIRGRLKWKK